MLPFEYQIHRQNTILDNKILFGFDVGKTFLIDYKFCLFLNEQQSFAMECLQKYSTIAASLKKFITKFCVHKKYLYAQ